ncbi:hypothetical protein M404DRAFT_28521 [Pisolithus tinctorius Marx 270]|uniref:Uncharacterized protein n=1 Tax=Pisolithus tinctorius Marx 270 TaxID=870435 RepID=A0A0C3JWI6_PISTI|nr:hypothetical protein M404DRAFT_28521 [Pisolithus tinctorius Marx 270]
MRPEVTPVAEPWKICGRLDVSDQSSLGDTADADAGMAEFDDDDDDDDTSESITYPEKYSNKHLIAWCDH